MYIELVKYPDPLLREVSKDVTFPLDDKTSRLIKFMYRAMYQHHGIGLAAVQIGYTKRMFVMDTSRACLLYTSPSPRDGLLSRMPSSA